MPTTLCFDFGNTRKKVAVFNKDKLSEVLPLTDDDPETLQTLIDKFHPEKTILSSVIDHHPAIEKLLSSQTKFHRLNYLTRLPFTTPVNKPETIGADRLALAAAAVQFYPKKNNLVIGMGTCITYNFINKYHEFLGGAISPGMEMRFKTLNQFTAQLPLINAESNIPLIGYDTKTNILSGVLLGLTNEMDGFIDAYKEKFRNFNVLLTGGDLVHLASHFKNKIFADPDLIFKGLYVINKINNP